ncbi:cold-shock protein [Devosia sp. 17-2-E-8]|nr:cold-shock protein [Devosia sp. 17-2-E-8]
MISGTVKFYNTTKGFGFIAPDDGGKDAFVQAGAVERAGVSSLGEGQKIYYDIDNGRDRRMAAINLRLP